MGNRKNDTINWLLYRILCDNELSVELGKEMCSDVFIFYSFSFVVLLKRKFEVAGVEHYLCRCGTTLVFLFTNFIILSLFVIDHRASHGACVYTK